MNDFQQNPYQAGDFETSEQLPGANANPTIAAASLTGSVITAALAMGLITVTGVILFLRLSDAENTQRWIPVEQNEQIFLAIGFLVFFGGFVMSIVLPKVVRRSQQERFLAAKETLPQPLLDDTLLPDSAKYLLGGEMTQMLMGQALCEGPAIVNLILFLLEGNLLHLIPAAVGLAGILVRVPTTNKLRRRLEETVQTAHTALVR